MFDLIKTQFTEHIFIMDICAPRQSQQHKSGFVFGRNGCEHARTDRGPIFRGDQKQVDSASREPVTNIFRLSLSLSRGGMKHPIRGNLINQLKSIIRGNHLDEGSGDVFEFIERQCSREWPMPYGSI